MELTQMAPWCTLAMEALYLPPAVQNSFRRENVAINRMDNNTCEEKQEYGNAASRVRKRRLYSQGALTSRERFTRRLVSRADELPNVLDTTSCKNFGSQELKRQSRETLRRATEANIKFMNTEPHS